MNINLSDNQSICNCTREDEYSRDYRIGIILTLIYIIYSITSVLGIAGNGLVIWIAGFKMKTISAVWFLNLAIADFICCLSIPLLFLGLARLDIIFSAVIIIIMTISSSTSVCFLTAMSIDRCVSVMWPFWSKTYRTPKCIRIISAIIWVVSFILTVLALFLYIAVLNSSFKYRIISFFTMFIVPFTTILICYYIIFLKLRKAKRPNRSQRPYRIITAIVICFFICWFPYNIIPFIPISDTLWVTLLIFTFSAWLAFFNSCINPILYVFICQDFKENLINSLPPRLRRAIDKCSNQSCRGRENDIEATDNMREIQ
ncbi:formyl peptide receptor-related sequence 1-like [Mixophyes fleayi]|uniref:formyl peptide receptor-related sequence 1-like n=1 Tax=Mixophyes fleayi TaxID=3061075 RepID=UPI003F4DA8F6